MDDDDKKVLLCFANFGIFVVFWFVICLCKAYYDGDNELPTQPRLSHHENKATGIDHSVLRSIPVVSFVSRDSKDIVECVVCLSELVDGDKARVLPSCDHCFHADCIDKWLQSASTCPICRIKVEESRNHDLPLSTDAYSGEAYQVPRDLTAVVIDIPAELEIGESGLG